MEKISSGLKVLNPTFFWSFIRTVIRSVVLNAFNEKKKIQNNKSPYVLSLSVIVQSLLRSSVLANAL